MATKVNTQVEPLHVQSTISSNSTKVSKFGAKSGFVIPKNKLSGSLVPIIRAGEKVDASNILKEEGNKQAQRKTKWGIDMTQDASVKKGRVLAYQTRLEQIIEQLKIGDLDSGSNQSLKSVMPSSPHKHPGSLPTEVNDEKLDQLQHEKRVVIGEILTLNPSYKVPLDYKPLLKEAKISIPVKEYPEHNFIGLLLGSESNTQKRLEEETGVKIRVYGMQTDSKEKHEITRSEELNERNITYEELYVHVSADTYDKVDAAVALLELLITPASGKPAVSAAITDNTNSLDSGAVSNQDKGTTSSFATITMDPIGQPVVQTAATSSQTGPLQYQPYPGPWYPINSAGAPLQPLSGVTPSPVPNNPMRFPASPVNPSNRPPFFGVQPPRNPPNIISGPQPAPQIMQQPANQAASFQKDAVPVQKSPSHFPVMPMQPLSISPSLPPTQLMPAGPLPAARTGLPPSQPSPMSPLGSLPNRSMAPPLTPGNTSWPAAASGSTPQSGPNNNKISTLLNPHNPHSFPPRTLVTSPSGQNMPAQKLGRPTAENFSAPAVPPPHTSFVNPADASAIRPQNFVPSSGHRPWTPAPLATSVSGLSSACASVSVQAPVSTQAALLPMASLVLTSVSTPIPTPMVSNSPSRPLPVIPGPGSGNAPIVSAMCSTSIPPVPLLRPPRPTSSDFTFQPARAPVAVPLTSPRSNSQPVSQVTTQVPAVCRAPFVQSNSQMPARSPLGSSFRPALQNPAMPPLITMGPPMHQAVSHLGQSHSPIVPSSAMSHSNNSANFRPTPGPLFPNSQNAASVVPLNHTGVRSLPPVSQASNIQGVVPSRPLTLMPLQKPLAPAAQSHGFLVPNQHMGKPGSGPIGNQVYDPFSPTSIRPIPSPKTNDQTNTGKSENDAEYEDLMASVGVR